MKVLVTGSKGQLGIELTKQLLNKGYTVIGHDVDTLDITDLRAVKKIVEESKPDVVVNCAAFTNVDACETEQHIAFKVNAIGAQNLAIAANDIGAKIVQISTDYVFDGDGNTPLREYDKTNPQSIYGKSKEYGEILVRESNHKHYIMRTAWLYGEGNNFVRTMLKLAKEKDELGVVGDQFGSPTSTVDLTKCIIDLIQTESYGTYHSTCEGQCSWYDFALKIFEIKGIDIKVNKLTTEQFPRPAHRPKYSVLEKFKLNLIGLNSFRQWEEALMEYVQSN